MPDSFVSHFVIGLTLGWLRERTGSLLPAILAHGIYNVAVLSLELWA